MAHSHAAREGLSGFISDSRPVYPWRRGAECEEGTLGGVGVLPTGAGGGGDRRYRGEELHFTQSVGGKQ